MDFRGRTLEGDALNQIILRRAGIETADGVVVVTNFDMTNAVIGHIAQTYYKVPSVVVGNFEPRYRYIYDAFNLQVVSPSHWGAQRIEELLYSLEARMVFSAGNGEVELYEFLIPQLWEDRPLNDLIPQQAGRATLPRSDTVLKQGDLLLVGATLEGITILRQRLENQQRQEV